MWGGRPGSIPVSKVINVTLPRPTHKNISIIFLPLHPTSRTIPQPHNFIAPPFVIHLSASLIPPPHPITLLHPDNHNWPTIYVLSQQPHPCTLLHPDNHNWPTIYYLSNHTPSPSSIPTTTTGLPSIIPATTPRHSPPSQQPQLPYHLSSQQSHSSTILHPKNHNWPIPSTTPQHPPLLVCHQCTIP